MVFSVFVDVLLLVAWLVCIALAYGYLKRMGLERGRILHAPAVQQLQHDCSWRRPADLIIVFLALEMLFHPALWSFLHFASQA